MNEEKRKRLAELEAESREQDRKAEQRDQQHAEKLLDIALEPVADSVVVSIVPLADALWTLGLMDEENRGTPRWQANIGDPDDLVTGIEVAHPEPRLYAFAGDGSDTIVASRMRDGGRYEHAVIGEDAMPIEWRTGQRPHLN